MTTRVSLPMLALIRKEGGEGEKRKTTPDMVGFTSILILAFVSPGQIGSKKGKEEKKKKNRRKEKKRGRSARPSDRWCWVLILTRKRFFNRPPRKPGEKGEKERREREQKRAR